MYQSYHSTKWPIVPATMLTGRRGRSRTSESPGGLHVPEASGEFVVIERSAMRSVAEIGCRDRKERATICQSRPRPERKPVFTKLATLRTIDESGAVLIVRL